MNFKSTLLATVFAGISTFAFGQKHISGDIHSGAKGKNCASHEVHERMMAEDANYRANQLLIEKQSARVVNGEVISTIAATTTIRIPVVVHVIYNTAQQNISTAQIQSQIAVLNEDFRKMNADVSKTPTAFASLATDVNIEFYLATTDPNGNPTTGITRKSTTKTSWGTRDAMKKSKSGGVDAWNTAKYLNMWVCNIGGGILGYAQFPGGTASTDGVVMGPNYFGSSSKGTGFYLSAPYDKGRTATHEVGHWLNLRHIWGDATCGNDQVSDTPAAGGANYGCPTFPKNGSCGTTEMTMNYMDYTDDACMYMFTPGQKARARALFEVGGARASMGAGFVRNGETVEQKVISSVNSLELFPNPAVEVATVKVGLVNESSSVKISVSDIQGKEVYSFVEKNVSSVNHELQLSGFKAGVYFVTVTGDSFREVKKLIVQ